jgi:hypothetical protein
LSSRLSLSAAATVPTKVSAKVMWGRRLLGETPLSLKWPRDSGPVDIVVQAPGYTPVHTRLYTFADDKVIVKLLSAEEKKGVFGYKRELAPAAGAPAAAGAAGASDTAPAAAGPSAVAVPAAAASPTGAAATNAPAFAPPTPPPAVAAPK